MGKVYATSDWHGCDWYKKVLDYLQKDDVLYFIGDSIDRGPAGIEVFDALHFDKRVIMLKGNHEDMFADFLFYMKELALDKKTIKLYTDNGGSPTLDSIRTISQSEKDWYIDEIRKLPDELIYHSPKGHDVILEHAGFTPFDTSRRSHDPLWDRAHFHDKWNSGYWRADLAPATTYIVHGHTPVQVLKYYYGYIDQPELTKQDKQERMEFGSDIEMPVTIKPTVVRYCEGHKFDIDMCTYYSDRIALLDLDTFEVTYIDK